MKYCVLAYAEAAGLHCPTRPRQGDAGYDIRCAEEVAAPRGQLVRVKTGLVLAIPPDWVGLVKGRSSGVLRGLYVHNTVIDSSYRGELLVLIENHHTQDLVIRLNDRIAQLVIVPHYSQEPTRVISVSELGASVRGGGGFGSTGVY